MAGEEDGKRRLVDLRRMASPQVKTIQGVPFSLINNRQSPPSQNAVIREGHDPFYLGHEVVCYMIPSLARQAFLPPLPISQDIFAVTT